MWVTIMITTISLLTVIFLIYCIKNQIDYAKGTPTKLLAKVTNKYYTLEYDDINFGYGLGASDDSGIAVISEYKDAEYTLEYEFIETHNRNRKSVSSL